MFLKLTNMFGALKGDPIYVNMDQIMTIHEKPAEDGGGIVTWLYGGPKSEVWYVEESPAKIYKMLKEKNNE